jgi:hypothetical protein
LADNNFFVSIISSFDKPTLFQIARISVIIHINAIKIINLIINFSLILFVNICSFSLYEKEIKKIENIINITCPILKKNISETIHEIKYLYLLFIFLKLIF